MARPAPAVDAPVFKEGAVVLAYHGDLLYEARVRAVHRTSVLSYTVSYQGWARSWDAQVPATHVLEHNDRNLEHAHMLLQSVKGRQQSIVPVNDVSRYMQNDQMTMRNPVNSPHVPYEKLVRSTQGTQGLPRRHPDCGEALADTNVTDVAGTQALYANGTPNGHLPGAMSRPRTVDHENTLRRSRPSPGAHAQQSSPSAESQPNGGTAEVDPNQSPSDTKDGSSVFHLPSSLKAQLVDDWEFITKEQRLVPLPREFTVDNILDKWVCKCHEQGQTNPDIQEVAEAIKIYFDTALPTMLLYRFERLQYNTKFYNGGQAEKAGDSGGEPKKRPIHYYGAEHLARLLLKMPFMLQSLDVENEMLEKIADKINDLARFIVDNGRILFLPAYEHAPSQYVENVRKGITEPTPESAGTDPAQNGSAGNTNGAATPSGEFADTPAGMSPDNMSPIPSNTNTPGSSDRGGANGIAQSAH